jgi:hypothetical protein
MVGVKPLVRRGPDLGLEMVAEEPDLPLYGAETAPLARQRLLVVIRGCPIWDSDELPVDGKFRRSCRRRTRSPTR